jgi:hypothetical protein
MVPQQGQRGRTRTRALARRIRKVAMEFGMWRSNRSGRSSGSVSRGKGRLRARQGREAPEGGMVAISGSGTRMLRCRASRDGGSRAIRGLRSAQSNFMLQFEVVTLDPPAQLGMTDYTFEADVDGYRGEPSGDPVRLRPLATRSAATPRARLRCAWHRHAPDAHANAQTASSAACRKRRRNAAIVS